MAQGLEARNVIDYATLTVNTAVGLAGASPAITSKVKRAVITVMTDSVYYREDGSDATSSEPILYVGDRLQFMDANYQSVLNNLSFLRVTTNADLKITYYD